MSLMGRNLKLVEGGRILLDVGEVAIEPGHLTAIIGPNGAGKTSLLRVLLNLDPKGSGECLVDGTPLSELGPMERARRIAYLPQRTALSWPLSVRDVAALGRFAYGAAPGRLTAADKHAVSEALAAAELSGLAEQRSDTLSGGEFARLMVARALAAHTPYLLADEPAASLDPRHQHRVMQLLAARAANGMGVGVVLHDLNLARDYANHVLLLLDGELIAEGTPSDILTAEHIERSYGIEPVITDQAISFPAPPRSP